MISTVRKSRSKQSRRKPTLPAIFRAERHREVAGKRRVLRRDVGAAGDGAGARRRCGQGLDLMSAMGGKRTLSCHRRLADKNRATNVLNAIPPDEIRMKTSMTSHGCLVLPGNRLLRAAAIPTPRLTQNASRTMFGITRSMLSALPRRQILQP